MTKSQHKRTTEASMFQTGISRNSFCRGSHIYEKSPQSVKVPLKLFPFRNQCIKVYTVATKLTEYFA